MLENGMIKCSVKNTGGRKKWQRKWEENKDDEQKTKTNIVHSNQMMLTICYFKIQSVNTPIKRQTQSRSKNKAHSMFSTRIPLEI